MTTELLSVILDASVETGVVMVLAALVTFCLLRHAAAVRHQIWLAAILGALLFPILPPLGGARPVSMPPSVVTDSPKPAPARTSSPTTPVNAAAGNRAPISIARQPTASEGITSPRISRQFASWAIAVWASGLLYFLGRIVVGLLGLRSIAGSTDGVTSGRLAEVLTQVTPPGTTIRLLIERDARIHAPMTWGVRRASIALPADAVDWPEERLRAALLHEIGHIERRDWLGQMIAAITCAVYWFHPLVWLAASRMRLEGESAADDYAITAGIPALNYAEHLLEIARQAAGRHGSTAVAMTGSRRKVERRMRSILNANVSRRALSTIGRVMVALLLAILLGLAMSAGRFVSIASNAGPARNIPPSNRTAIWGWGDPRTTFAYVPVDFASQDMMFPISGWRYSPDDHLRIKPRPMPHYATLKFRAAGALVHQGPQRIKTSFHEDFNVGLYSATITCRRTPGTVDAGTETGDVYFTLHVGGGRTSEVTVVDSLSKGHRGFPPVTFTRRIEALDVDGHVLDERDNLEGPTDSWGKTTVSTLFANSLPIDAFRLIATPNS